MEMEIVILVHGNGIQSRDQKLNTFVDRHQLSCLEAGLYVELGIRGHSHGAFDENLPGCLYRGYVYTQNYIRHYLHPWQNLGINFPIQNQVEL